MTRTARPTAAPSSSSVFAVFTNRKIGTKIAIGFAAIQVLMAILAVMNYTSFGTLGAAFTSFGQRVEVVDLAHDIDGGFVALRNVVREYGLTGDEPLVAEATQRSQKLVANIAQGARQIQNPDIHALLTDIEQQFGLYGDKFAEVVKLRRDQNRITLDVLGPVGQRLMAKFEQLQSVTMTGDGDGRNALLVGQGLKSFMMLRLAASKMLGIKLEKDSLTTAEKSLADLKTALSALKTSVDTVSEQKQIAAIEADLAAYADGFRQAGADVAGIETKIGEMSKVAETLSVATARINQIGAAEQQQIGRETQAQVFDTRSQTLIITISAQLLGIVLAWLIGRAVSRPIVQISDTMRELASGNLDVEVAGSGRRDEIGLMACTVEVFKSNALEVKRLKDEQEEAERRVAEQHKAEMRQLADDFEGAVGEIIHTVSAASTELETSAGTLTSTADRSQELATSVAAASEQASANVQSVASATEQMASSISEISRQVQEAARIAGEAVDQARKTNTRIGQLSDAANRIGDVVDLINTIAGQTNLLALNATIEAARAGDAGRGFAVVAQEVKALAEQTAKATGEISQQIGGMQSATQDSVGAIREIGGTIERMSEIASTIASAVEEQGAATQEISRNVQQAARGTQQVSSNIVDVQRGASETGSASSQVLAAAQLLSRDSTRLRQEVGRFVDTVRAA
ncbi:methyl-accepting chemotaxis protein [Rhodopseudomonas palustris]|uniref:HAMP domain-containing methyl-accepting chemotaxis protein n=1 Tax=Rhodopseudomonas palustris TaxID=1076 RepID=UPI0020CC0097|nr:methyl-accepting chemotaxis protein [Rhodopseudomonas palustris]MCP9626028.1 methyl-accepting chemotaxis protein [Rhodopseudomonas palustris]